MKVAKVNWQRRFDFGADLECEHCGHTATIDTGYDDARYLHGVIPSMLCSKCGVNSAGHQTPVEGYGRIGIQTV